jgi:hypothetical protein
MSAVVQEDGNASTGYLSPKDELNQAVHGLVVQEAYTSEMHAAW